MHHASYALPGLGSTVGGAGPGNTVWKSVRMGSDVIIEVNAEEHCPNPEENMCSLRVDVAEQYRSSS